MKKIYLLLFFCSTISFAQSITITKVVETDCQSQARLIELYVDGTVNLGSFDLNIVNGDFSAWNNIGFGNLNQVTMTDQFFYVVRSTSESDVAAEFPNLTLNYDKESAGFNAFAVSGSTNGDKSIRVLIDDVVVDQFGFGLEDGNDGEGTDFDHRDQVVVRLNGEPNNGNFDLNQWEFTGFNSVDPVVKCTRVNQDTPNGGIGIEAFLADLAAQNPSIPYNLGAFVLSTKEFSKSELSVYPNPVDNGIININSTIAGIKRIELTDVTGRSVLKTDLDTNVLDLTTFNAGLYFLKVSISDRSSTRKLVIK